MNDITYQTTKQIVDRPDQSNFLTEELERLWLLSALRVGLDQKERGQTIVADATFFDEMHSRLFDIRNGDTERVIDA